MKRFLGLLALLGAVSVSVYASETNGGLLPDPLGIKFNLRNIAYAYNAENASYWEETRVTLTYIEDLLEPSFTFSYGPNSDFRLGAGLLLGFDQENKLKTWYPVMQYRFRNDGGYFVVGTLENDHDFPAPILDPLTRITPQIRVLTASQVPITSDTYPLGMMSHGFYEYGIQYRWDNIIGKGELYLNWQLPDTTNHRERFDVGLIENWNGLYGAAHYWHNGGHENPHPVSITENYTGALGFKNSNFTFCALASYFLPDRDVHPESNVTGFALLAEYRVTLWDWDFEFIAFCSDNLWEPSHQFISVEGDPFYRVPAYLGLNIAREFRFNEDFALKFSFVNGTFLPYRDSTYSTIMIRYDQYVAADFHWSFDIVQAKTN